MSHVWVIEIKTTGEWEPTSFELTRAKAYELRNKTSNLLGRFGKARVKKYVRSEK